MSDLRASDEDRDRAASEIRAHFAAGRLTEDELNERMEAVYRARTHAELRELRRDLPALPSTHVEAKAEIAERRARLRNQVLQQTGTALTPFVICTVIWALSGANGSFWPAWLLIIAVIPLIKNGWRLYGPAPDLDELERELSQRRKRR